jgi:hypothetical protein
MQFQVIVATYCQTLISCMIVTYCHVFGRGSRDEQRVLDRMIGFIDASLQLHLITITYNSSQSVIV